MRMPLLLPALCGCSLLGLYDDPPVDPPEDTEEACTRLWEAYCDALKGCCQEWPEGYASDCAGRGAQECIDEYSGPVDAGLIALDPFRWQPCLDEIAAFFGACSTEPYPEDAECFLLWVGLLRRGESCESTSECAPGLECYSTCLDPLALPGDGQPCLEECTDESCWLLCAADHYCDDEEGICSAFRKLGEPCEIIDDYADDCGEDLMCDGDLECVSDLPGGADCTTNRECHSYSCEGGRCVAGVDEGEVDYCEIDL